MILREKVKTLMLNIEEKKFFKNNDLPSISVIIPTLNCDKFINICLDSIIIQDYPKELIEILIIDGGSTDSTVEVVKKYTDKIYNNPLKTGEAGKAIGVKNAKNELIALIDSDNILPKDNWFKKMVQPFLEDKTIIGSEPIEYTYRKNDGYITRYCALMGMNDIVCLFIGNYDRFCYLSGKWTNLKVIYEDKGNYLKLTFNSESINQVPTLGANGTFFKRDFFNKLSVNKYLFDIDLIIEKFLNTSKPIYFAKVKDGIIHIFSGNIKTFIIKQKRRVIDYRKYKFFRKYQWNKINKIGLIKYIIYTTILIPLLVQSLIGYFKKRDIAWFFHPIACWITLWIYSKETIMAKIKPTQMD